MDDQERIVELACEGIKVSKRLKALIPDVCWLYYNDMACQAEICRRLDTSPQSIDKITHSGIGMRYEKLMAGDGIPAEHKPYVGSHRSTRGRW